MEGVAGLLSFSRIHESEEDLGSRTRGEVYTRKESGYWVVVGRGRSPWKQGNWSTRTTQDVTGLGWRAEGRALGTLSTIKSIHLCLDNNIPETR